MTETVTEEQSSTAPTDGAQQTTDLLAGDTPAGGTDLLTGDTPDEAAEQEAEGAKEGAPEAYEFKAPEGQEFDPSVISAFSEVAKELNLSQENAQKLLDRMSPVIDARQQAAVETLRTQWADEAKGDQEFGGEKLDASLGVAKKALDQFGSAPLKQMLKETGLGNHPEVIRLFVKVGQAISEDGVVMGKQARPAKAPEHKLYPSMNK